MTMVLPKLGVPRRRARDRHLAATVKVRLMQHPELEVTSLRVRAKAGVVLLRGRVPTAGQKQLAAGLASAVPGVAGLFNELQIDGD